MVCAVLDDKTYLLQILLPPQYTLGTIYAEHIKKTFTHIKFLFFAEKKIICNETISLLLQDTQKC